MHRVLFLGSTRLGQPLDATNKKKYRALASMSELWVIGFSGDGKPHRFDDEARFYLLPAPRNNLVRYALLLTLGTLVGLGCVVRHGACLLVAQSPYEGAAGAFVKLLGRAFRKKVALIIESHGDFEVSLFMQRKVRVPSLYRWVMGRAAEFALQQADGVRVISEPTRAQITDRVPSGIPLAQFPAWTDMDVFSEAAKTARRRENGLSILYAGVLIPRKGVHFLLRALADICHEYPAMTLTLVGAAENPDYARGLRDLAQQLGIAERIDFIDALPQVALAQQMASSSVLVLPSISEGLGRVVFEAMASGLPVIGSDVGGIPEQISDGETGFLVPPGDVAALADRLRWVAAHPEDARKMGERAREVARSIFSTDRYLRGYGDLFEQVTRRTRVCQHHGVDAP